MKDIYNYKFKYKFKKYELVKYNKVMFKNTPYPFNINKVKVILEGGDNFIGLDACKGWWHWWEIVPDRKFNRIIYWMKFYPWYFMKFKK